MIENDRGNSLSSSRAGERATGAVKALTERAPMARKIRTALENIMIGCCEEGQITTAPGLKFGM